MSFGLAPFCGYAFVKYVGFPVGHAHLFDGSKCLIGPSYRTLPNLSFINKLKKTVSWVAKVFVSAAEPGQ